MKRLEQTRMDICRCKDGKSKLARLKRTISPVSQIEDVPFSLSNKLPATTMFAMAILLLPTDHKHDRVG